MGLISLLSSNRSENLFLPAHGRGKALPQKLRKLLRLSPGIWDLPELFEIGGPLITDGEIVFIFGLPFPFILPLLRPEIYAGTLNKPWDKDPSLSAFITKSAIIFEVSSSHPLFENVFLASS